MTYAVKPIAMFAVLLGISFPASAAHPEFRALAERLPYEANVLLLFNVEDIFASPLAQKQGWQEKGENAFAAGLTYLPPQANHFVMASQLDLEMGQPHWQVAVMDLKNDASMPKLAAMHGGSMDEFSGHSAAALPPDTYVIQFRKNLVAVMSPADRQKVGRYVRQVYSNTTRETLSEYLQSAEAFAEQGVPIIMSVDLQHIMSADVMRDHLETFESLKGKNVDMDQVSKALATIRGFTLGVNISDHLHGALIVDFDEDVSLVHEFAQPLLLEALGNHGAMIEEFKSWKPSVEGKRLKIQGPLSASGMRRIMSLVDTPPAMHVQPSSNASEGQSSKQLVAMASQQHFKSVKSLLDDLNKSKRASKTMGQSGLWFEKYARKIENLPILNVDPDLVEFSANVADQLRQAHQGLLSSSQQSALRQADAPNVQSYNVSERAGFRRGYYGGVSGGYAYRARYAPRRSLRLKGQQLSRIRTEERIQGSSQANTILETVEEETAEIRRKMTEKYGVEF